MSTKWVLGLALLGLLRAPALFAAAEGPADLDVPYEPTHPEVVEAMLRLAGVGAQDFVIDLGCGDGRMVIAAAKQFGARGLGVDIDPRRVEEARDNVAYEGLQERVRIEHGDIFQADIREASVVTLYLLNSINLKLRPKLFRELRPGTRVVSHAFDMEAWEAEETAHPPRARENQILLWRIPAHAGGVWTTELAGPRSHLPATLRLRQEYQILFGEAETSNGSTALDEGSLRGERILVRMPLVVDGQRVTIECEGLVQGDQITGTQALKVSGAVSRSPWSATRTPVDLAGTWSVRVAARPDVAGQLVIERATGLLQAAWVNARGEREPLEVFYAWGSSVRFAVTTDGNTRIFQGLLVGDRGEGTVNSEGWSVAQHFVAVRGAAALSVARRSPRPLVAPAPKAPPSPEPRGPRVPQVAMPAARVPQPGDERTHPQDGSVLVWVPGGEFVMGAEDGAEDERPPTKVAVGGFWMGKHEVTYAQYAAFLKANPRHYEPFYWNDERYAHANLPVIGLTWNDAQAYCRWAGLRLPSEREWEYAAAGGRQLRYPTATGEISAELAACRDDAQHKAVQLSPVGSFAPNPFGLFDLAGNAWELTSTLYRKYPYDAADGRESSEDDEGLIVLRGGAWSFPFRACRTSARHYFAKHLRYDFAGLRVAASAVDAAGAVPAPPAAKPAPSRAKK